MSTRCNIVFADGGGPVARIYQHFDGYPDGPGGVSATLAAFFDERAAVGESGDFCDPSILAAQFVAWKLRKNRRDIIGILSQPQGDEEYIYTVNCAFERGKTRPVVTWTEPTP